MMRSPAREELSFATIALIATNPNGSVDEEKVKALIKVFRPARDGTMTKLDFVKSVDNVYRSYRLLLATIANSGQIDQSVENILNLLFYIILGCVILSVLGFDPLALFISFSSVFLAFAFVFSSASAKYFEGMIFILVQRPYGRCLV
jgi:small-conductance mechanosensitive channel